MFSLIAKGLLALSILKLVLPADCDFRYQGLSAPKWASLHQWRTRGRSYRRCCWGCGYWRTRSYRATFLIFGARAAFVNVLLRSCLFGFRSRTGCVIMSGVRWHICSIANELCLLSGVWIPAWRRWLYRVVRGRPTRWLDVCKGTLENKNCAFSLLWGHSTANLQHVSIRNDKEVISSLPNRDLQTSLSAAMFCVRSLRTSLKLKYDRYIFNLDQESFALTSSHLPSTWLAGPMTYQFTPKKRFKGGGGMITVCGVQKLSGLLISRLPAYHLMIIFWVQVPYLRIPASTGRRSGLVKGSRLF